MGVLDDAIREHLELKRRRGADAAEVARQEQEALGPARRGPEPLEVTPPPAAEPADADDQLPEPVLEEHAPELDPEPAWEAEPELEAEPEAEPEPQAYREPEPAPRQDPEPEVELYREPEREPEPARDDEPELEVDQPTVAFDAADLEEAQRRRDPPSHPPRDDADDVLEETPDFLQETPEHDRLWFEQRPPRDFDFDG